MSGGTIKQGRCTIRLSKIKNSVGSRGTKPTKNRLAIQHTTAGVIFFGSSSLLEP